MPPGIWSWSDVRTLKHNKKVNTPPTVAFGLGTNSPTGERFGTSEITTIVTSVHEQMHISAVTDCGGCEIDSSGPCMHHYLPICFKYIEGTATCPNLTVQCNSIRKRIDKSHSSATEVTNATISAENAQETFVFVTAASRNHQCPLLNLLRSLQNEVPEVPVVVYDLEAKNSHLDYNLLRLSHHNIIDIVRFDYQKYPDWFDVQVRAGEYAWKPHIIKEVVDRYDSVLWLDSGNMAIPHRVDIHRIKKELKSNGYYSPRSQQTPWHWVHPGTFSYFGHKKCCADPSISTRKPCCCCGAKGITQCHDCGEDQSLTIANASYWLQRSMCNGALVGFSKGSLGYKEILVPWCECALRRHCIAPLGPGPPSHRGNHRQDQAALTMLSILHNMPCVDQEKTLGFRLHQDNRWTNTSYCSDLSASSVSNVTESHTAQTSLNPALHTPADTNHSRWRPWASQRTDILSRHCLTQVREKLKGQSTTISFTHVINPFPTSDVHFNWTIAAIEGAYRKAIADKIEIEILAILFEHEDVVLPDFVTKLRILNSSRAAGDYLRNLGVEFGPQEVPLHGPIVSDVFQAIYDHASANVVIWSNFDLIVHENFYIEILGKLAETPSGTRLHNAVGFSTLRLDMLIPLQRFPTLGDWTVNDFFRWNYSRPQAGHDCMVFPKMWIPCMELRYMVFGVGGWDHAVYSQMKRLARLENKNFITLTPGKELPAESITRHIGSQIANAKKHWTNPISWKGPAREAQYNFNKRCKADIEIYLALANAASNLCKKAFLRQCGMSNATFTHKKERAPNNDYRLVGLAAATPWVGRLAESVVQTLTGFTTISAHNDTLTVEDRNEAMAVTTHAMDMLPGPKPFNLSVAQDAPVPGKKGRIVTWRAVMVILDDPVHSVLSLAQGEVAFEDGETPQAMQAKLTPFVERYNSFWRYWTRKAKVSQTTVRLIDLDLNDSDQLALELTVLHQYVVYHRCGPSERRACFTTDATTGVCCALSLVQDLRTQKTAYASELLPADRANVTAWIRSATQSVTDEARAQSHSSRTQFAWPQVYPCCTSTLH